MVCPTCYSVMLSFMILSNVFLYHHLFVFIKTINHSISACLFMCWDEKCQIHFLTAIKYSIFVIATKSQSISFRTYPCDKLVQPLTWQKAKKWNWATFRPDWFKSWEEDRVSSTESFNWLCPCISSLTNKLWEISG